MSAETLDFRVSVLAADGGCVMADAGGSPCDEEMKAHHAITQQQLRKRGLDAYLWDPANGVTVCETHHRRHHNRREPILRAVLPQRVLAFVAEHDLGWLIERYYA